MPADKKTCECTEGAATAVQAMHGDSFSKNRVDPDPKTPTSFGGDFTGPPALPCSRDDGCPGRQRRCGAQVVSLTLGDALTNSRRWLTYHRQNLYSDEDHLRPATSLVLPDRRDKFEDFDSIRLVLQQFLPACCSLLLEGH